MSFLNSGQIVSLSELCQTLVSTTFVENRSYRVTGIISSINHMKRYCEISHEDASLFVELEIISMNDVSFLVGGMIQFIGEVKLFKNEPKVCLSTFFEFFAILIFN